MLKRFHRCLSSTCVYSAWFVIFPLVSDHLHGATQLNTSIGTFVTQPLYLALHNQFFCQLLFTVVYYLFDLLYRFDKYIHIVRQIRLDKSKVRKFPFGWINSKPDLNRIEHKAFIVIYDTRISNKIWSADECLKWSETLFIWDMQILVALTIIFCSI